MLSDITKEFYTKVYVLAGVDESIYDAISNGFQAEYNTLRFTKSFYNVYLMGKHGYVTYIEEIGYIFTDKFIDEVIND